MTLSLKLKAIFLLLNYGLAAYVPPRFQALPDSAPSDEATAVNLVVDTPSTSSTTELLLPRATTSSNNDKSSCDRCRKCPRNTINDSENCRKCVRCKRGSAPDEAREKCVRDPAEKEKRYKEVFESKKKEYQERSRKEEKEKKYRRKRLEMLEKYRAWDQKRRDETKRKQVRRVGRCLTIVPLVMSGAAVSEYGAEFFSEGFLESMELTELWPDEQISAEFLNDYIDSDEYVDLWVQFANDNEPVMKRSVGPAVQAVTTYVESEVEKRCIPLCLIPIFAAVAGTAARVGARAATAGGRIAATVGKESIKIAKGAGKVARVKQLEGAKKIAQNKNWIRCIRGQSPIE